MKKITLTIEIAEELYEDIKFCAGYRDTELQEYIVTAIGRIVAQDLRAAFSEHEGSDD